MNSAPSIPAIQYAAHDAMQLGRAMRGPGAPEGFAFNPYRPFTPEWINFATGCIVAAFPQQVPH